MLRRIGLRRAGLIVPDAAPALETDAGASELLLPVNEPEPNAVARGRAGFGWRRATVVTLAVVVMLGGAAYSQMDRVAPAGADLSRRVIGDENTARVEGWMFRVEDRVQRTKYKFLGGADDPFATREVRVQFIPRVPRKEIPYYVGGLSSGDVDLHVEDFRPPPLAFPATTVLQSEALPGEGSWSVAGLPRNVPGDSIMARTFVRPDKARPYATVGVLLVDQRRVRLSMVGGTAEPGGDRGVRGPGIIPKADYDSLLLAFNGGFKGPHGGFGMIANGNQYMPMRNGLATVCSSADGSILMGEFGRDFGWKDSFEACRQNAILMVDKGEVSRRTTEGNDTWGYVKVDSSEFITWRSAVGLTKDGNLLIAAGNSLSADTLAKALWASGAYMAMQLDINGPYISTALFYQQPDGSLKAEKFMESMAPSPSNFLGTRERDFFYVTLDESRFE